MMIPRAQQKRLSWRLIRPARSSSVIDLLLGTFHPATMARRKAPHRIHWVNTVDLLRSWLTVAGPSHDEAHRGDEQKHSELQLLCLLNLDLLRASQPETFLVSHRAAFPIHISSLPLSNTIPYLAIKSKPLLRIKLRRVSAQILFMNPDLRSLGEVG
ncbi:MAG: hypothetical protein QG633_43 [Patescibacteria group bacterium]|nr:hypothetical protein [Patescibacteria group bacterium]